MIFDIRRSNRATARADVLGFSPARAPVPHVHGSSSFARKAWVIGQSPLPSYPPEGWICKSFGILVNGPLGVGVPPGKIGTSRHRVIARRRSIPGVGSCKSFGILISR